MELPLVEAADDVGDFSVRTNYGDVCIDGGLLNNADLFLFDEAPDDPDSGRVREFQLRIFNDDDIARWTHVGIFGWAQVRAFGGKSEVWDAVPEEDVRNRAVSRVLEEKRPLLVLRGTRTVSSEAFDEAIEQTVDSKYSLSDAQILYALIHRALNVEVLPFISFSFMTPLIPAIAPLVRFGLGLSTQTPSGRPSVICSTYVERVIFQATNHNLVDDQPIVLPGDYASLSVLEDVELIWLRLSSVI